MSLMTMVDKPGKKIADHNDDDWTPDWFNEETAVIEAKNVQGWVRKTGGGRVG